MGGKLNKGRQRIRTRDVVRQDTEVTEVKAEDVIDRVWWLKTLSATSGRE